MLLPQMAHNKTEIFQSQGHATVLQGTMRQQAGTGNQLNVDLF